MTRVLALDLSLSATGIVDTAGDHEVLRPRSHGDDRLAEIAGYVHHLVNTTDRPHIVAIEDCLVRTPAAAALALLHGAVRLTLMHEEIRYLLVSPATLKVYGTGRGNATKADMRVSLLQRTGLDVRDDNAVDARWLWYLAHDLLGQPVLTLPQNHRRALTKLELPEGMTV